MLIWTLLELVFEDTEAKSFCLGFFKLDLRGPAPDPDDIVEPMDKLEEIVDKLESKLSLLPP